MKKLIEVALPLEAINIVSAREKSIRHGLPLRCIYDDHADHWLLKGRKVSPHIRCFSLVQFNQTC